MQSGDSTPRATGLLRRSEASCSVTNGGPSSLFFSRYRRDSGISAAAGPGSGTVGRGEPGALLRLGVVGGRRGRRRGGGHGHRVEAFLCLSWTAFARPRRACCTVAVHVVVVGCGRVGSGLAVLLSKEGHSVAVLDKSPRAFRRLKDWNGPCIVGSGFDRDDLEKAGANEAGALAAVTSGDNTNILTVRIARETYKIPHVVARIYDPRRAEIYQRLGIPTVATVTWTIDQVRRRLLPEETTGDWSDASGRLSLLDRSLPDNWAGRALRDIEDPRPHLADRRHPGRGAPSRRPRARRPGGRRVAPCGARRRPQGPRLDPVRHGRASQGRGVVRVAIAGAGSVGTAIASDLRQSGHDVLVLEQDPDLVERLRPTLDITWIAADACEVSSLDAAGLATVDVVVAATGDDEDNLVISLLAKQEFAVPRVVARVNHPKNQWLFNESWGVDVSVSTPQLLTALVEEAVSVGALVRLLQFQGGAAHLVEITLAEDSPANDTAIADLDFPRDAVVVAVVRGDRLVVPRGDTIVQSGDEVLVLVTAEAEDAVHAAFIAAEL